MLIPIDFLETFEEVHGFLIPSDVLGSRQAHRKREEVVEKIRSNVSILSDIVMEGDNQFSDFPPSIIATAIILLARAEADVVKNRDYLNLLGTDITAVK